MKTFTQVLLLAGMVAAAAVPSAADAQVYVHVGPPRPIFERRPPPPMPGYVWHAGYHRWDSGRYIWVPGTYVAPPRPRAIWVEGRWIHGPRGYFWREGYWR